MFIRLNEWFKKKTICISCTLCVVLCILYPAEVLTAENQQDIDQWKIPAEKENFHIFLLMGQSNMAGCGNILPDDRNPVPAVVRLPTIYQGRLRWERATHPLHNRNKSDQFGLGIPFAKQYLKDKPSVVVGLIPVALGGAPIENLRKGTSVYADAIKKAKFAMTQGTIRGALWHQGESDAATNERVNSYEQRLHQLISDIRQDIANEQLLFIVGDLAEFFGKKYWGYKCYYYLSIIFGDFTKLYHITNTHNDSEHIERINKIRTILRALPDKVANTGFAESTGCTSQDRHMVHFSRKSYIVLGKRYAKAYEKITGKIKITDESKNK